MSEDSIPPLIFCDWEIGWTQSILKFGLALSQRNLTNLLARI